MLRIVVFDGGRGGDIVANFLATQLNMLEIIRVIDWSGAPYETKDLVVLQSRAEQRLAEYICKVDLIVLGGYLSSMLLETLQKKYPTQKFVGVSVDYRDIKRRCHHPERVVILANRRITKAHLWNDICRALPNYTLTIPDCSGWEDLINTGDMSIDVLQSDLEKDFVLAPDLKAYYLSSTNSAPPDKAIKMRPDTIVLLNTHFWCLKCELEKIFGYGVRIIDARDKLLHDICLALHLRGLDGKLGT